MASKQAQPRSTFQGLPSPEQNQGSPKNISSYNKKKSKKKKTISPSNPYLEARKKEYVKQQAEMEKPQYKDPTYFGHKRPPKKRPVNKRKLCKECGMVH